MMVARKCLNCGKDFETNSCYLKRGHGNFCSLNCSGEHYGAIRSKEAKEKIKDDLICECGGEKKRKSKRCRKCMGKSAKEAIRNPLPLSNETREKRRAAGRKGGLSSAKKLNLRSSNEILFASLCAKEFTIVCNQQIFGGWDADIILPELKIAVLWNGVWHYKKITRVHSLEQVQNRDRIKLLKIAEHGFYAYVIKDMGSADPDFVHSEFEKFLEFLREQALKG